MNLITPLAFGLILTFSILQSVTSIRRLERPDCCRQCRNIRRPPPPRRPLPSEQTCGRRVTTLNREISVLKSALNSQKIEVRLVSPTNYKPLTEKTFKGIRNHLINLLKQNPTKAGKGISMYLILSSTFFSTLNASVCPRKCKRTLLYFLGMAKYKVLRTRNG